MNLSLGRWGMVQGTYMEWPGNNGAQPFRVVDVTSGPVFLRISDDNFTYAEFITVLSQLVDGHTHSALVQQLQGELSSSTYNPEPH